jgi:hypothetical protein
MAQRGRLQFKEAIMERFQPMSAVAACMAAFFAPAAIAAEMAKEGTFTSKVTETGTLLQSNPIGKDGDFFNVYEENGTVEGSAGTHKLHSVWSVPS